MRGEPKTPYPFPPHDIDSLFPEEVPWDLPIADLSRFSVEIACDCHEGVTKYPLRLMAAELGWKRTLRTIVPKLRCKHCGARPLSVALIERANGDGHTIPRGRRHELGGCGER